ncbi:MAG: hypothetical protein ABIP48_16160 [Planctomycetota bacterium]
MSDSPFPAGIVIHAFTEAERSLGEIMHTVPYCRKHEEVWSPRFGEMLRNLCCQLDSLWRQEAPSGDKFRKNLNMKDYHKHFSNDFQKRFVVFWGEHGGRVLAPFREWETNSDLSWWTAHNDVKHDSVTHRERGTLKNVCLATAGLFVAIVKSKLCLGDLLATDWYLPQLSHKESSASWLTSEQAWEERALVIESKQFSYPVGASLDIENTALMRGSPVTPSYRFRDWLGRTKGQRFRDLI